MDSINFILKFDGSKSSPSPSEICIYTIIILLVSNLIFISLMRLCQVNLDKTVDNEREKEYKDRKKKEIHPLTFLISEIVNSIIYSPLSEELFFRFLLLKVIAIHLLKMSVWSGNILHALIFGSLHSTNKIYSDQTGKLTLLQTISSTVSAIVSGFVYVKSNSILPSLLAHIINNLSASISDVIDYYRFWKAE